MKGMKEKREDGAEINVEKHNNHFFLKFMLIRFIDTRSISSTKLKKSKENQIQVHQIQISDNF